MAFWDGGANALLVHPKHTQRPLWVLDAEDFIPIVWDGNSSFYIHLAQSFIPANDACLFYLRVLRSAQGGYVWAPEQHRDKIRVNGQMIGDDPIFIQDADIISVRPPTPKQREETLSITFFLPGSFLHNYTPKEKLKCGIFSRTYVCRSRRPQENTLRNRAVKVIRASSFASPRSFEDHVQRECRIVESLRQYNHRHIVQIYDTYYSPTSTSAYIVTEYPDQYLDCVLSNERKRHRDLAMWQIRGYVKGICLAIEYLHSRDIHVVLRNLSLKNIYLCRGVPKLSDFNIADFLPLDTKSVAGLINREDHAYLAPEAFQGGYQNEKVDCWSVGVIIKALLLGHLGEYGFHEHELRDKKLSQSTINLVSRLLDENPYNRLSMADTLRDAWFDE